jgi:hypothetical protein
MQRLISTDVPPAPGHYYYRCPIDGWATVCLDRWSWLNEVHNHYKANNHPMPENLEQIMVDQLCSTLPPGWCAEYDPDKVQPLTRITVGDVIEGMKSFLKWFSEGKPFVSQSEAERRADICSRCYLNVHVEGCSSCHEIAENLTRKVATSLDSKLDSCGICKCLLRAKVHFRMQDIGTSHQKLYRQVPQCWLNPDSDNYNGDLPN